MKNIYIVQPFFPVPPQKPVIKDINNIQLSGNEIGPLEVGEDLTVICEVAGGR